MLVLHRKQCNKPRGDIGVSVEGGVGEVQRLAC